MEGGENYLLDEWRYFSKRKIDRDISICDPRPAITIQKLARSSGCVIAFAESHCLALIFTFYPF